MGDVPILRPPKPLYPTASELYRGRGCIAPWALGLPEERTTNEYAERGQRGHTGAAHIYMGHGVPFDSDESLCAALLHIVAYYEVDRDACIDDAGPRGKQWFVEQGIRYRPGIPDVAEFVEREPGQRFEGWFSGTADLVYVRHDGVLVVADWKFGRKDQVEPAEENCQLLFLALAFATALGITGSSAGVVVARIELRFVDEDGVHVDAEDVTWGELCAFADELGALAERIDEGARPKINKGCKSCPSKAHCPAQDQLVGQVADDIVAMRGQRSARALFEAPKTPEDVRYLHFAIEAAEALLPEWKRLRDAYVLTHAPVEIGLGYSLKAIPNKDREVVDSPEALDVIERLVPGAVVVERKANITTIKKAARDAAGRDKHSSADRKVTKDVAEKEAFAALIEAGAVIDKGKKLVVRVVRSDEAEE